MAEKPSLEPIRALLKKLTEEGVAVKLYFDSNIGYELFDAPINVQELLTAYRYGMRRGDRGSRANSRPSRN